MASKVEVLVDSFQLGESVELIDGARRAGMRIILMKQETAAPHPWQS